MNENVVRHLQETKDEVFNIWEARVREFLPLASPVDSKVLINSLPELYDELVKTLSAPDYRKYLSGLAKELGRHHGEQRSRSADYDLNHVIEEYQLLREVIFEVVRRLGAPSYEVEDAILEAIRIGIRNATAEFVIRRSEAIAQSQALVEMANIAKASFLANMSHEIRTPLGAMLGYAELLKNSRSMSERDAHINVIIRNGQALAKLIDDVLDLSKVEAGHLDVENISFVIEDLVHEVTSLFQESVRAKNVSLTVAIEPGVPKVVKSDPTRISQILINIVGNAIKFTSSGSIHINVSPLVTLQNEVSGLRFTITDTGIGITDEAALLLFEPFTQADNTMTRKFGGTGLGLVLSRHIARALGGDVELKKFEKGQGCTFIVTIMAKSSVSLGATLSPGSAARLEGIKILLVEDSPDTQYLVKRSLELRGAVIDTANNGEEGVNMAKAGEYGIVLMDMQMPILDGYQATKRLRELGYKRPIIALTAHALTDEKKKTQAAGCNAHITKPINTNLLVATIKELNAN